MKYLRILYIFFDEHVTLDFGAKINDILSPIWHGIHGLLFPDP